LYPATPGRLLHLDAGGQKTFYYDLTDQVGSVMQVIREDGTVVNRYDYDAFGNAVAANTSEQVENRYRFQGREYDAHRGDYYFRNRTYIPEWGVFTGPDALVQIEANGPCNYLFANNNPLRFVDPEGLWTWYLIGRIFYDKKGAEAFENSMLDSTIGFGGECAKGAVAVVHPIETGHGVGVSIVEASKKNAEIAAKNNPRGGFFLYYDAAMFCVMDVVPGVSVSQQIRPVYKSGQDMITMHRAQNGLFNFGFFAALPASAAGAPRVTGSFKLASRAKLKAIAQTKALARAPASTQTIGEYSRFRGQGFTPAQSKYLTQPYRGMGHHFAARRHALPSVISENPLNVMKPRGISIGRFYERHFMADPHFFAARFPRSVGGVWNGTAIGLQKPGFMGRLWYGSPGALKITAGAGAAAGGGGALYWWLSSDEE
jgi:RHS repeat-associated protein